MEWYPYWAIELCGMIALGVEVVTFVICASAIKVDEDFDFVEVIVGSAKLILGVMCRPPDSVPVWELLV